MCVVCVCVSGVWVCVHVCGYGWVSVYTYVCDGWVLGGMCGWVGVCVYLCVWWVGVGGMCGLVGGFVFMCMFVVVFDTGLTSDPHFHGL